MDCVMIDDPAAISSSILDALQRTARCDESHVMRAAMNGDKPIRIKYTYVKTDDKLWDQSQSITFFCRSTEI